MADLVDKLAWGLSAENVRKRGCLDVSEVNERPNNNLLVENRSHESNPQSRGIHSYRVCEVCDTNNTVE